MNLILAIDDRPDNLVSIKALLNMTITSCEVRTASSGPEGISIAREAHPDVILLDIHMPEMDGFEVCRILKEDPDTSHIPIIILTAMKTGSHHRVRALELGADAFLTKPINESELAAQVRVMLRIKAAEDRLRKENERLEEQVRHRVNDLMIANEQLMLEMGERETAQQTLAESEIRFKTMFDKSPLPMVITDAAQDILAFNDKFTELFGYTLNEVSTAEEWWQAAYPDDTYRNRVKRSWEKAVDRAVQSDQDIETQSWEITTKSGNKRTCEFNMVPLGEVSLIVMNDITDRMTVETQRRQLERQLQQAQKMEAVGALAGGIAHDFNNILYPLIGFTELLKEDIPDNSPLSDSVEEILSAAFRARELVRQILSFSRQMDQEVRPVKIQPIVKEAVRLSSSIIPATISIAYEVDKSCRPILADPTQVHQLLMNLITNAYHAMEEDGGELAVTLTEISLPPQNKGDLQLGPGDYACLRITDTGTGMTEEVRSRIFDPYFTTKGVTKGTGLGLSVVHGIVKNYRGEIRVISEPGQGSEFEIFFPVAGKSEQTQVRIEDELPRGTGRILLVDDESHIIKIEQQMLARLGYEVVAMDSPHDAYELFSARPDHFDLMITDMTMPGLTGDQLAVKCMTIRPGFPVIICTGFSDLIDKESARKLGCSGLLMKPILKSDLAHAIHKALQGETG
ncbi:MAG: response regulator [Desulfobacterales bacterium]|nr:response regulator [Desulfobacterales bacterium]